MDGDPVAIARMYERHAHFLQLELNALHEYVSAQEDEALALREENAALKAENARLQQRIEELTGEASGKPERALPAFVKANVAVRPRRRPGREKGHEAALRPRPRKIDVQQDVPLPVDGRGQLCCPHCRTQLSEVKHHRRMVEDLIPSKVVTTCYRTHSGYCPHCRRRIESRAEDQPPAANLPHAQLGLNALATAAVLRVCYRLPLRQVTQLFEDLPGLTLSPAAVSKQLRRLSHWLKRPALEAHAFFKHCKSLAQEMLRLKKRRADLSEEAYGRQVKSLETRLRKLGAVSWDDTDADRLAARVRKYQDRLTTFLHDRQVDGTNNAAERALRPAVVMRKITGGSRSESGAQAWAILASVMRTAQQQGRDGVETIKELLRASWAGRETPLLIDTS